MSYMRCSSCRVPIARLAAAQVVAEEMAEGKDEPAARAKKAPRAKKQSVVSSHLSSARKPLRRSTNPYPVALPGPARCFLRSNARILGRAEKTTTRSGNSTSASASPRPGRKDTLHGVLGRLGSLVPTRFPQTLVTLRK